MKNSVFKFAFLSLLSILLFSCSSEKEIAKTLPQLSTTSATNITLTSASSGGNITTDGGAAVTARGVVWNTATAPTIGLTTKTTDGFGTGNFSSAIANLTPSTNYYARAYATNSVGTGYGNEITFTTGAVVLPTLTTTAVTGITTNSAISGGTITADGGGAITARGLVWSTSQNPTITLTTKTSDGTGTGSYTSNLTNLAQNTTYYIRAYATNSAGTTYGNQISITSLIPAQLTITDIDGNNYQTITINNQVWTTTNLNVSRYRNGDVIPQVTDPTQWSALTTGAWCYYNNDPANGPIYGKLYNWYAVNDPRGLAPTGYHIPAYIEWNRMTSICNGSNNGCAAPFLKECGTAHWITDGCIVNYFNNFKALPGGYRFDYGICDNCTYFNNIGKNGYWWCSTGEFNTTPIIPACISISYNSPGINLPNTPQRFGLSIRCVKD
jgi:uncharacterized protein (TIGR02145 family)